MASDSHGNVLFIDAQSETIVLRSVKRIFLEKLEVDDSILKGV